jgi:hypothetical protein
MQKTRPDWMEEALERHAPEAERLKARDRELSDDAPQPDSAEVAKPKKKTSAKKKKA